MRVVDVCSKILQCKNMMTIIEEVKEIMIESILLFVTICKVLLFAIGVLFIMTIIMLLDIKRIMKKTETKL